MTFLRPSALCIPVILILILGGCDTEQSRLFERLPPDRTGVRFSNSIVQDDTLMNSLNFLYLYNGGGVAVGDVNGDQRPDLYFAGNQVENRLYLNQGDVRFRDVTEQAGVGAAGTWSTGVSMIDVNQDGRLDVYVSVGGPNAAGESRANKLFVNQGPGADGTPSFEEKAHAYGIASAGYTTHAAFFDYDRDGDLDLYVLNNAMGDEAKHFPRSKRTEGEARSTDRLYRNNGDGTFTDVSQETGIQIEGHSLGVGIADVNKDGWPDIYVANDFMTNDLLYVNNGDGTFTNRIGQYLKHQPYSAMGIDVADVNNDMRIDIMALDMLPWRNPRLRLIPKDYYTSTVRRAGYEPQYVRNTLQLNNGPSPAGHPTFSEISQLAGVDATGWSWAPLFADFDNDGDRDLFVSNGYGKDATNLDFADRLGAQDDGRKQLLKAYKTLPRIALPNRFFENRGRPSSASEASLQFADRSGDWTSEWAGISNGAAFADLDQDGDLDLVTNNLNDHASILENHTTERDSSRALRVRLHGPPRNRSGLGAKVRLYNDGTTQYHDHTVYRGYQSTVGRVVHFGLGADSTADSLSVVWPGGRRQQLTNVSTGQTVDVYSEEAARGEGEGHSSTDSPPASDSQRYHLSEVSSERGLTFEHTERTRPSINNPLLPHGYSRNGPGIAVGDVNGDSRDDVFVGGDPGQERMLFLQTPSGEFTKRPLQVSTKYEDMGALFFDADGDGDLDLYVVSGGGAGSRQGPLYQDQLYLQDRLYVNDGRGRFDRASDALPRLRTSGSVVTAADYDDDGDLDLFVGGRVKPGRYPLPPRSFLLRNDSEAGTPAFTAVTDEAAPDLKNPGLVTDALWTDYDTDGDRDLMVVGEWMPVQVYRNEDGHFEEVTKNVGLEGTSGWWNNLTAGDFDRDGDPDYVVGNLGLNTKYEASPDEPVQIHAKDFDQNGDLDPVISRYVNGTQVPAHERDDLVEQIPAMKNRFSSYREYGNASFDEVLTPSEQEGAYVRSAVRFETSYLENREDGTFEVQALPVRAQTAPVFGILSGDYNDDGVLDVLMTGNWYASQKQSGRADAFIGAFFQGDGTGDFQYVHYTKSGFFVDGDGKGLAEVSTGEGTSLVLAAQHNGPLKAFQAPSHEGTTVSLNPRDQFARITYPDGSTRRQEFYWGSSYLSQSSRVLRVPSEAKRVVIHSPSGTRRPV